MFETPRVFCALDLEFTQPNQRILQVGYCVGDITTGEILARGAQVVNPGEPVSDYITNLTGITQAQADQGVHVATAYRAMAADHRKHGAFRNLVVWGGGDCTALYEAVFPGIDREGNAEWVGGRREIDVKTLFIAHRLARGEKFVGGLARSMTRVGLAFEGRKHNAGSDSHQTFVMFCRLLGLMRQAGGGQINLPGGVGRE